MRRKIANAAASAGRRIGKAASRAADLNGDGIVDRNDATIAAKKAHKVGSKVADAAGALAKDVAKNDMAKDAAAGAAIGALAAMPLPIVGPAVGAAVGAIVGVTKNLRSARNPETKSSGKRQEKS